jgi:Ca-activated chloride channel family protein
MRSASRAVLAGLLVVLLTVTSRAAGVEVRGTIVDPAGAVVPGATVELLSGSVVVAKATTSADGGFLFDSVAAGAYEIRVTLQGFRQARVGVSVGDTAPRALRLKLEVGNTADSVTVRSATPPPPPAPETAPALPMAGVGSGRGGGMGYAAPYRIAATPPAFDTATYSAIDENRFRRVTDQPLSTFSIDVDTASYANVRRFLNAGQMPPANAVRVEELINYFHFDYPETSQGAPFGVTTEVAACPWDSRHRLALIGLQAKRITPGKVPPRNLVFLLDVSGSMAPPQRLPLVQAAMKMLVDHLREQDRVAIVTYAGTSGVALPSTSGDRHAAILDSIESLHAGGSTNGAAGILLAYKIARENFVKDGVNRVILATDGDFNVGVTSLDALTKEIETERTSGVYLSVLGVGDDNLKDATMERLADKGNGNYSYLDSLSEAQRVLVSEADATIVTVAKDVKIQVEFNPAAIGAYRLVGYEDRRLKARDFNDDTKDAGELGAGHTVTALYEIVPPGEDVNTGGIDPLKYQRPAGPPPARVAVPSSELMTVKVRYKKPDGAASALVTVAVAGHDTPSPRNLGFAAAVAEFGMLLRDSPYKGEAGWQNVVSLVQRHRGADADGYRAEFSRLVDLAAALDRRSVTLPDTGRR